MDQPKPEKKTASDFKKFLANARQNKPAQNVPTKNANVDGRSKTQNVVMLSQQNKSASKSISASELKNGIEAEKISEIIATLKSKQTPDGTVKKRPIVSMKSLTKQ